MPIRNGLRDGRAFPRGSSFGNVRVGRLAAGLLPIKADHHSDRQHYREKHVRKRGARGIRQRAIQKIGTECCTERDQYYS
jgi:hypothetical protein